MFSILKIAKQKKDKKKEKEVPIVEESENPVRQPSLLA